jgi:CTP synthase (UTP-ammonia lyase)
VVYQGDITRNYQKVSDITSNFDSLKVALLAKYKELNALYKSIIDLLKQEKIIDSAANTKKYLDAAATDMGTPLTTYYKTQVKEKYGEEVVYNDSVFFIPIINRVFEMTRL